MASSAPKIGDVIAEKYRIEGALGQGGMAVVFAAHHELLDKPIAVKVLSPAVPLTAQTRDRFLTEARAAARVDSPHVARVMDVGTLPNGLPYMVMERLEGCDFDELLKLEGRLAIPDAIDYVLQALQGLAHAHTLGVVHRDLKPANLFLAHQSDGTAIVKILDFGIAKLSVSDRQTEAGQTLGSPAYMSPERIRNSAVDHRADIWSMGVVLYEFLTGSVPFDADGVGETFAAVLERTPAPPSTKRAGVPPELDRAVMKCLEREPGDRFADVAQLARAIAPFGSGVCAPIVDAIENTLRQRLRRYSGRAMLVRPTPMELVHASSVTADVPTPRRGRALVWAFGAVALIGVGSAALFARARTPASIAAAQAPAPKVAPSAIASGSAAPTADKPAPTVAAPIASASVKKATVRSARH